MAHASSSDDLKGGGMMLVRVGVPTAPPVRVTVGVPTAPPVRVGVPPAGVLVGVAAPPVTVAVGPPPPTVTFPSVQFAVTAPPLGSLAPAFEQVSGLSPAVAPVAMAIVHVYKVTGQVGRFGQSVFSSRAQIGHTLSSASTKARTPVQLVPTVQPGGWKANDVPPLLMSGFTEHIGLPFDPAATAASATKVMSFCVPAMASSVSRLTSTGTKSPGAPLASPIAIVVPPGGALVDTVPLVPVVGSAPPAGSLAPSLLLVRGKSPVAPFATATWQVYMTAGQAGRPGQSVVDVPQIGQTLSSARTSARTPVHASPVQPGGWKANDVPPLLMAGLTAQSGLPLAFAATLAMASNVMSF